MLEAASLAFLALHSCARGSRHYKDSPASFVGTIHRRYTPAIAAVLLVASFACTVLDYGGARGAIAWFGIVSLAAIALVVALSWQPDAVMRYAGPAATLVTVVRLATLGW